MNDRAIEFYFASKKIVSYDWKRTMEIYYVFYLFFILLYWLSDQVVLTFGIREGQLAQSAYSGRIQVSERNYVTAVFVVLILIFGLRHPEMGRDLNGYLPAFDAIADYTWEDVFSRGITYVYQNFEVGYVAMNKLISFLGGEHQIFLFICAVLSLYPVGKIIYKQSRNTAMSMAVYLGLPCFLMVFSGLRQAIAIAMTFAAYPYIREKRPGRFAVNVLFACLFHYSAFVCLLAYPLYHIKLKQSVALASCVALPLIWIAKIPIFMILARFLKQDAIMDNNGAITLFLVYALVYFFCVFLGDRDNPEINGLANLFYVACCVQAIGGVFSTVMRVGYYFMIYLILLLPELLQDLKKTEKMNVNQVELIEKVIFLCFVLFGLYSLRNGDWAESYPYIFFWKDYYIVY